MKLLLGKRSKLPKLKKSRKDGKPQGYPRFKSKHNRQTYRVPQARRIAIEGQRTRLPKVGLVKTIFHRPLEGKPKPDNLIKAERRLKQQQRDSCGREKVRQRLARQHEKVSYQRRDFQHKL